MIAFIVPFRQRWSAIYDNGVSLTSAIVDTTFIVCILLNILYSGLSLLRIKSYKRQVTDYSADIYRMSLDWLSFIILFRVVLQILPIAGLVLGIGLFNKLGFIWAFTILAGGFYPYRTVPEYPFGELCDYRTCYRQRKGNNRVGKLCATGAAAGREVFRE